MNIQYLSISAVLLKAKKPSLTKRIIYAVLIFLTRKGEEKTYVGGKKIASMLGITPTYVYAVLKGLVDSGVLLTGRDDDGKYYELDMKIRNDKRELFWDRFIVNYKLTSVNKKS
jgi:DNA-binding MarR family transcriptional regulator